MWSASRHDEAAADVEGLAGDPARLVAGEVDGERGDLLRLQPSPGGVSDASCSAKMLACPHTRAAGDRRQLAIVKE
jgi:hypothetical protein